MSDAADTSALRAELETRTAPSEAQNVVQLIDRNKPELAKLLEPVGMDVEAFKTACMTQLRFTPLLYQCDPYTVVGGVRLAAQLGLPLGPLGYVYLVPFHTKSGWVAQFLLGYKGKAALAYRSRMVGPIDCATVYEHDGFSLVNTETGVKMRHEPKPPKERGEPIRYYAKCLVFTGPKPVSKVAALWPEDVERRRLRSPSGRKNVGPWATDYEQMAWKSCGHELARLLPQSPDAARAELWDDQPVPMLDDEPPPLPDDDESDEEASGEA